MSNDLKAIRPPARNLSRPPVDTTTPLPDTLGKAPLDTLPEPPATTAEQELAPQQTTLVISVTILHRGRLITIASEGRTLDAFCDLLDKRFGVAK